MPLIYPRPSGREDFALKAILAMTAVQVRRSVWTGRRPKNRYRDGGETQGGRSPFEVSLRRGRKPQAGLLPAAQPEITDHQTAGLAREKAIPPGLLGNRGDDETFKRRAGNLNPTLDL
jgi:hypothetical protein